MTLSEGQIGCGSNFIVTIRIECLKALFVIVTAIIDSIGACGENGVMSRLMLKPDRIVVERRPDQAYDKLFPYYVELCATSQFRSKLKGEGGVAGHAVMLHQKRLQG